MDKDIIIAGSGGLGSFATAYINGKRGFIRFLVEIIIGSFAGWAFAPLVSNYLIQYDIFAVKEPPTLYGAAGFAIGLIAIQFCIAVNNWVNLFIEKINNKINKEQP